jgi:hypothetical protein
MDNYIPVLCRDFDIDNIFSYRPPKEDQIPRYEEIRSEARKFAHFIKNNTPDSPEQYFALRKLSDAVMQANMAIAVNE